MAGIAVTRSDPGYIGGRGIPPLPLAREQMAGPRRDRHHRHLSCSLCVQVARVCLVFLPIYGCYILRKIFLPPKDTSLSYSPAKKMEAPHTAGAEDGKRWRWLYIWDILEEGKRWRWLWIFWKMEKGEDGISGPTPKVSSKISFLFSFPDHQRSHKQSHKSHHLKTCCPIYHHGHKFKAHHCPSHTHKVCHSDEEVRVTIEIIAFAHESNLTSYQRPPPFFFSKVELAEEYIATSHLTPIRRIPLPPRITRIQQKICKK